MSDLQSFVVVTDRGGHLHNAWMLLEQIPQAPQALVTTPGPELKSEALRSYPTYTLPYLFTWWGKTRFLNPIRVLIQCVLSCRLAWRLRPQAVISLGATDVVFFCYWAKLFGARIFHVECMNQVKTPSKTGRLLYPICEALFVQWRELLTQYGAKARYAGWVLS